MLKSSRNYTLRSQCMQGDTARMYIFCSIKNSAEFVLLRNKCMNRLLSFYLLLLFLEDYIANIKNYVTRFCKSWTMIICFFAPFYLWNWRAIVICVGLFHFKDIVVFNDTIFSVKTNVDNKKFSFQSNNFRKLLSSMGSCPSKKDSSKRDWILCNRFAFLTVKWVIFMIKRNECYLHLNRIEGHSIYPVSMSLL